MRRNVSQQMVDTPSADLKYINCIPCIGLRTHPKGIFWA